ncbi:hypothetical protein CDAR_124651 [Caerostris darwini]|uniref:Uncharacterized protein n=1 Tax=Caerostris darwini TaxID=1538125 RepID=A0AAV4RH78_9ARAC|nr:hypothetical protein CDAR_124651 [Caerostris darwini]
MLRLTTKLVYEIKGNLIRFSALQRKFFTGSCHLNINSLTNTKTELSQQNRNPQMRVAMTPYCPLSQSERSLEFAFGKRLQPRIPNLQLGSGRTGLPIFKCVRRHLLQMVYYV